MRSKKWLVICTVLWSLSSTWAENDKSQVPTVEFSIEVEKEVLSDIAVVRYQVITEDESFKDAVQKNRSWNDSIRYIVKQHGILDSSIKVQEFNSSEAYRFFIGKINKHKIESSIEIRYGLNQDMQSASEKILNLSKEVKLQNLSFELSNPDSLQQVLLNMVFDQVNVRKKILEKRMSKKLDVVYMQELSRFFPLNSTVFQRQKGYALYLEKAKKLPVSLDAPYQTVKLEYLVRLVAK